MTERANEVAELLAAAWDPAVKKPAYDVDAVWPGAFAPYDGPLPSEHIASDRDMDAAADRLFAPKERP